MLQPNYIVKFEYLGLVSKVIIDGNSLMQQAEDIDLHTLAQVPSKLYCNQNSEETEFVL